VQDKLASKKYFMNQCMNDVLGESEKCPNNMFNN